jgi:hypothetical protein
MVNLNTGNTHFNDFNLYKSEFFGNANQRAHSNSENIKAAKENVYHYGLFIHTWNGQSYSGVAKNIPSKDFVVSLGYSIPPFAWPTNSATNHSTGTSTQQKGTLIHELGHTIGLGHGGRDGMNFKPNYLSRMNYHFQLDSLVQTPLDYSRCELNLLNENTLIEAEGVGESCPSGLITKFFAQCPSPLYPNGVRITTLSGSPIDWDIDNNTTEISEKNVNCDYNDDNTSILNELEGYSDWSNLIYIPSPDRAAISDSDLVNLIGLVGQNNTNNVGANETAGPIIKEMTPQDLQAQLIGEITGIDYYINNISNDSFKIPIVDPEGNPVETDTFAFQPDPAKLGRGYYGMILGTTTGSPQPNSTVGEDAVSDTVIEDIRQGDMDSAINKLENFVLPTADSSFGGQPTNDFIIGEDNQLQLAQRVIGVLNNLKAQTCSFDECK